MKKLAMALLVVFVGVGIFGCGKEIGAPRFIYLGGVGVKDLRIQIQPSLKIDSAILLEMSHDLFISNGFDSACNRYSLEKAWGTCIIDLRIRENGDSSKSFIDLVLTADDYCGQKEISSDMRFSDCKLYAEELFGKLKRYEKEIIFDLESEQERLNREVRRLLGNNI